MRPIISASIRLRHPETFVVGDDSIIDDYCYFSTKVRIGRCSHIASSCTVAGGADRQFVLGDFSSLSAGVRIWCASDDFVRDLVTIIPTGIESPKGHVISGDVIFGDYTAAGANAVVMPANEVPEGTVIGALSFVPARSRLEPWSVYAGTPIRLVGRRDRDGVLGQAHHLRAALDGARAQ